MLLNSLNMTDSSGGRNTLRIHSLFGNSGSSRAAAVGSSTPQTRVSATHGQELRMGSLLEDFAVLQYHDSIREVHRAQPVGDHEGGSACRCRLERVHDRPLGLDIETARGFVQDE